MVILPLTIINRRVATYLTTFSWNSTSLSFSPSAPNGTGSTTADMSASNSEEPSDAVSLWSASMVAGEVATDAGSESIDAWELG